MDQSELRSWESRCIQEEPPACRAACPIGVDARGFVQALARDDPGGARAILDKTMPLAAITARLCEAPCEEFCLRKDLGGPVAIGELERFCARFTGTVGKLMRLPPRTKRVTVIGAAPSGLTVAFDLAKKGYPVTVFHDSAGPGGWLRDLAEEVLPATVVAGEFERLQRMGIVFQPIEDLRHLFGVDCTADACYVGFDDEVLAGLNTQIGKPDSRTMALSRPGWFGGGLSRPGDLYRFISDVSQGREAAVSLDRYLQGVSLTAGRVELRHGRTALYTRIDTVEVEKLRKPSKATGYDEREAVLEAGRCLDCQCLECVRHCEYLKKFKGYPKTYVRQVYNNSAIVKGTHLANRLINSCSLCGQCAVLCPNDFSMADLCLQARQMMVREGRMPPSAHWFALDEMESVIGASFVRHAPKARESSFLFFPGCQLTGIRPDQSVALWDLLREEMPTTGIWFDCCGAPARWAGREVETDVQGARLEKTWHDLGCPQVLTACATCLKMFRDHLPGIAVDSVWNVLAGWKRQRPNRPATDGSPLALADPCTARHDETTQASVRRLLKDLGQPLAPLSMNGELTECCGFGGLMENANPELARKVGEARVAQSPAPFLTYCAMCRDQLAKTGKQVFYLLDLLLPETAHESMEKPVSISVRRENRRWFAARIGERLGIAEPEATQPWMQIRLIIDDDVGAVLEQRRILTDDIRQVIWRAGRNDDCFVHGSDGRKLASAVIGPVTFWVEFVDEPEAFRPLRAWSHRMSIVRGKQ